MKKTVLNIILLLACSFSLSAQIQLAESNTEIFENVRKSLNSEANYNLIGFDGYDYYLLLGNKTLCKLNAAVTTAETFDLPARLDSEVVLSFGDEENMGLICFKKTEYDLIFSKLTLDKIANDFVREQIIALPIEEDDKLQLNVGESNYKSAQVVFVTLISAEKEYKMSHVLVFGTKGELLWQTEIMPRFEHPNFTFNDIAVNADGTEIYLLGKSYDFDGKFASNTVLQLLTIDQSGITDHISEKCPFAEIRSLKFKLLNNNNLFVAGFYRNGVENETDGGSFSAVLDRQRNSFELNHKLFKESLTRGTKMATAFMPDFTKKIAEIYELSDTNIVVLGEDRQTKMMTKTADNAFYTSYSFSAGNIFAEFYAPDGTLKKTTVIYKNQTGSTADFKRVALVVAEQVINDFRHLPISFSVIQSYDKLLLIFNDNAKNSVNQNVARRETLNISKLKTDVATVLCSIEGTTLSRRKMLLINTQKTERVFSDVIYTGERKALILTQLMKGKGNFTFEKLNY
ncbi:MAG: hypothetical protein LBB41_03725 [Prevotellaceae bacterium]|jgi:hypothetical protein|nr:hypothetical protein [Prevotellaceae bacterium]